MRYDVFISYRRDGGEYMGKILRDRLYELGYRVFFDVESLRSGDFNTKLYSVIDECEDFVIILSPNALDRCSNEDDWVRREIEYAMEKGKNIIPVMLRDFSFPEILPTSINDIRYKNGIEANSQLFDAFIDKLQQFLKSKPPIWQRMLQNVVFKRTLPLLLSLSVLIVVVVGVSLFMQRWNSKYPRTNNQKNLTSESVYYIVQHLTKLNIMAGAVDEALQASQQYVSAKSKDFATLKKQFDIDVNTLEQTEVSSCALSGSLDSRLQKSPFPVSDFSYMHNETGEFKQEWIDNLEFVEWAMSSKSIYTETEKLFILDNYRVQLEQELRLYAYGVNEMLLCVTEESVLDDFFSQCLPYADYIPLKAATWSGDKSVIESGETEALNKIEKAVSDYSAFMGKSEGKYAAMREVLIQNYIDGGLTRKQAEELVQKYDKLDEDKYEKFSPKEGDSFNIVWKKMASFIALGTYDGALDCVDFLWDMTYENEESNDYLPALYLFINNIETTKIDYGIMVFEGNQCYMSGDIIIEINGEVCHNMEEYSSRMEQLAQTDCSVTVLRVTDGGELEKKELMIPSDMTQVRMESLTEKKYN